MAHILLAPVGSHGDVHPFIGLGAALLARGHRVSLATAEPFAELSTRLRFHSFHPTAPTADYEAMVHDPDLHDPHRGLDVLFGGERFERLLRRGYEVLAGAVGPDTVLVSGSLGLAARLLHEKTGVPFVTVHLQPLTLQSAADAPVYPQQPWLPKLPTWFVRMAYWWADRFVLDPLMAPPLNRLRVDLGLPPIRRVWGKWRHSPQRVLGLFPDWFGSAPDWPPQTRLTGFVRYDQEELPLPEPVERFLSDGPPPVAVTFGSAMRTGRAYFDAAVGACRAAGVRGLLLGRAGEQIPPLPDGFLQVDYAPFSRVFGRSAAVIHHGGVGTTAQALAAGVPQLVVPMVNDQYDNADRVRRLGVGRTVSGRRLTTARATVALRELRGDPSVSKACAAVRAKVHAAPDPAGEACRWIEELVPPAATGG